jgi:hypothetical protein
MVFAPAKPSKSRYSTHLEPSPSQHSPTNPVEEAVFMGMTFHTR